MRKTLSAPLVRPRHSNTTVKEAANAGVLYACSKRHASLLQRIRGLSDSKMANSYKPDKFTSKNIPQGPQAGSGYDPVYNNFIANKVTGPLRRKSGSSQEDFLDVDELAQWMEAKHAAKVLHIKEADLPTLTKAILEEKWRTAYRASSLPKRGEVLVATEVLLEYIDSSVKAKKSKQYYRDFVQNARLSVDDELQKQKAENRVYIIYIVAALFTGACVAIVFVAYFRNYVGSEEADAIGGKAADYVNMTFMQNNNVEDPPDYSTRYFHTPTAMEVDKKSGRYDTAFLDSEEVRLLQERQEYNRREEAEMLRMLNDATEAEKRAVKEDAARGSRVSVFRHEDVVETDAGAAASRDGDQPKKSHRYEDMPFRDFAGLMASGFGGGSRFQRLTSESSARAGELRKIKERREATGESSS